MAAEIKDAFDTEPELIGGGGGIFDVEADGAMVFSKHKQGRFPENHEVLDQLHKMSL